VAHSYIRLKVPPNKKHTHRSILHLIMLNLSVESNIARRCHLQTFCLLHYNVSVYAIKYLTYSRSNSFYYCYALFFFCKYYLSVSSTILLCLYVFLSYNFRFDNYHLKNIESKKFSKVKKNKIYIPKVSMAYDLWLIDWFIYCA
jgi:hypothetical protein